MQSMLFNKSRSMYSDDSLENRSADIVVLKFSREHIRVREMWQRENTLDAHRMEGAVQEHVSSQCQIEPNSALITQTTRTRLRCTTVHYTTLQNYWFSERL